MPAAQESSLEQPLRLGVIAGSGALPLKLLHACDAKGIEPFVIGFEGQTDPLALKNRDHLWSRIGAAGTIIKTLKQHGVCDLVLIGGIRRPSVLELKPDLKTAGFFARVGFKVLGDNGLLGALREELEKEGFRLRGVHEFVDDLLAREGPLGKIKPTKEEWKDIQRGIEITQALGAFDVGQAAIVQDGFVLGVEAAEGTDELIARCKYLQREGRGGVLVKTCKPQQDRDLDLPTIGPDTMRAAIEAGLVGIAVQAGAALIIEPDALAEMADRHKMFVIGVTS